MAERWTPSAGPGSGSERKTSSGRAGSSGFSGAGKEAEGDVWAPPTGYLASLLREMPAGSRSARPQEELSARGPGQAAEVTANLGSRQGSRPSTNPRPQTVAFTETAAPVKQVRQEWRGPGAHPLVATTLDQLLGTFKGPPQIGVRVTPPPKRGVATTLPETVKRAREIDHPSAGPAPVRVPPAKPGQLPTFNQMMQEFTGTPYGPTGERQQQAYNERLKDPAYRFAGPDTFNPATWDVHKGRKQDELWTAYAMAVFLPITQATLEKRAARHSEKEKRGEVAPPPLLDIDYRRRQQQFDEIRQLRPIFEAYASPIGEEMEAKQVRLNYAQMSDMGQPIPAIRQQAERYRRDSERIVQEALQKLSREEVRKAAYRAGVKLTRFQKEVLDSVADYEQISLLTSRELTSALGADVALNFLAGKVGGWAAAKLAARVPWLANAGVKLTTKLGADEAVAVEAKSGVMTTLKRGVKEVGTRVRPGEHGVASGITGGIQQPLTYALSDDHPTAGRLIQEAAVGFSGGLLGERAFTGAVRGLGVPGRWLAQWAEKHPSVEKVRQVLGLIGSGDIRFREGALAPEFSPKAQQVLGGGVKPAEAARPAAPPPKGAQPGTQPGTEIPTAPEQMPGAVAVSGEPDFSAAVLQSLAQARDAATARIAARRPRKAPARMPRAGKGMRPGAVIGSDALAAEAGDLFDHALIGATHLAAGMLDRKDWDLLMVDAVGEQIRPHLEVIRELARRIHQGWKEHRIPTQGARVREAARAYLQKLAAEAAPSSTASRGTSLPSKSATPTSSEDFVPDQKLTRDGKLPPVVEKAHQDALEQLRSGTGRWQYGVPDATSLKFYAQVGATYIAKGYWKEVWKERMLADLGREVEPHLDWLWQYTQRRYKSYHQPRWKESWNTELNARPVEPSGGAARHAARPDIPGTTAKANARGGAEERPLGRPLSSDKKEVTNWKQRMKDRNYPLEEIEAGIARYFDPVREQYADLRGKDNVFIPMPSTTGKNIVPEALARRLADEFGGEVLSREHIQPVHTLERKDLDVYQRFIQPAEYGVTTDLSHLVGKNVVLVDDILTSGDSTEGLRYALRRQGITRTDVVTLASSSRAATPIDLGRLSRLIAKKTGEPETVVKKLVEAQLRQAPRKLVDGLFRNARKAEHAEAIYRRLAGKRTAVSRNGG